MKFKKIAINVLVATLLVSSLAGCSTATTSVKLKIEKTMPFTYPVESSDQLKYYLGMYPSLPSVAASLNETQFAQELIKQTGINVTFMHPIPGQETEGFNLMIASNELPDIIESNWYTYPGGAAKAIQEEIIIPLNEVFEKVSPNMKGYWEQNPDLAKLMRTDQGQYYMYPFIRGDEILKTFTGGMVRKDLLDKAGLKTPETIADWDIVLHKFKEMGVKTPITMKLDSYSIEKQGNFIGAYGILPGFYHDGDVVKYGPFEKGYKDYIAQISKWYADGVLDQEFTSGDNKRITSIIVNGDVGATFGTAGGDFGNWISGLKGKVPSAEFTPVKYPVMNSGDRSMFGQKDMPALNVGAAITGQCKNIELAARLLDYGYSEAGQLLYNFGTEGVSFDMKDGIPTYKDTVMDKNKNGGISAAQAMCKYMRGHYNGPFIQNKNYVLQYYTYNAQKEGIKIWADTDAEKYMMPSITLTSQESAEYLKIMQDIDTYRQEVIAKYMVGKESMDTFDTYYSNLEQMNIKRAIEIQQAAYDRFLKR